MKYTEFDKKCQELGISKRKFAEMTGKSYSAVTNWSQAAELPAWVDSWLENYRKARLLDEIAAKFGEIYGQNLVNLG